MSLPLKRGDTHDVVIELSLNYDGLEFLVNELEYRVPVGGSPDGFVVELREWLTEVERERDQSE